MCIVDSCAPCSTKPAFQNGVTSEVSHQARAVLMRGQKPEFEFAALSIICHCSNYFCCHSEKECSLPLQLSIPTCAPSMSLFLYSFCSPHGGQQLNRTPLYDRSPLLEWRAGGFRHLGACRIKCRHLVITHAPAKATCRGAANVPLADSLGCLCLKQTLGIHSDANKQ